MAKSFKELVDRTGNAKTRQIAERRTREVLESGKAVTAFLVDGQTVRISMADAAGRDLFGDILQRVVAQ